MRLHDDILLDILCHLGRFNLDAVSISSRKLCQAVIHRMSKMCLRHLQSAILAGGIKMRPEGGDEVKHPKASDIGRRLRSSYVEYLTLTPECIKGRPTHIEGVVHEMLKHANTIAVDRMELSSVQFSPPELTLATRLVEALLAVNDVTFNGNFPERRFDPSKFELYTSPHRIMDEEILQYCKKKTANDSRRSVSFNKASVTEDFVRKVAEARKCVTFRTRSSFGSAPGAEILSKTFPKWSKLRRSTT